ncbi:MAG TPA: hypothetical protein VH253_11000 [Phycisphaerae bacterium]|nr:hypothetical protein [Phycisphaerae bacterium]
MTRTKKRTVAHPHVAKALAPAVHKGTVGRAKPAASGAGAPICAPSPSAPDAVGGAVGLPEKIAVTSAAGGTEEPMDVHEFHALIARAARMLDRAATCSGEQGGEPDTLLFTLDGGGVERYETGATDVKSLQESMEELLWEAEDCLGKMYTRQIWPRTSASAPAPGGIPTPAGCVSEPDPLGRACQAVNTVALWIARAGEFGDAEARALRDDANAQCVQLKETLALMASAKLETPAPIGAAAASRAERESGRLWALGERLRNLGLGTLPARELQDAAMHLGKAASSIFAADRARRSQVAGAVDGAGAAGTDRN